MSGHLKALIAVLVAFTVLTGAPSVSGADGAGLICFSSNFTGAEQIYTMSADGSNLRQLTSTSAYNENYGDYAPDLSPDSGSIVYAHNPRLGDAPGQIFVMNVDGGGAHPITHLRTTPYEPRFSPDGTKVVFQTGSGLYTVDANGTHLRKVLAGRVGTEISGPTFSPDGRSIAFAWKRGRQDTAHFQIYLTSLDGGRRLRLTRGTGNPQDPAFSPDGTMIAFVEGIDSHGDGRSTRVVGAPQIYTMAADGGNRRRLTQNPHGSIAPAFSPDGSQIAYAANADGAWNSPVATYAVHVMNADGGEDRLLTTPLEHLGWLSWAP